MRKELEHIGNIEQFLLNDLSAKDKADFANKVNFDSDLKEDVDFFSDFQTAVKRKELRSEIYSISNTYHVKNSFLWLKWLSVFAILLLFVLGIYLFTKHENNSSHLKNNGDKNLVLVQKKYNSANITTNEISLDINSTNSVKTSDYLYNKFKRGLTPLDQDNGFNSFFNLPTYNPFQDVSLVDSSLNLKDEIEVYDKNTKYLHYNLVPEEFKKIVKRNQSFFNTRLTMDELIDSVFLAQRKVCYDTQYGSTIGTFNKRNALSVSEGSPGKTLYFVDKYTNPYSGLIVNELAENQMAHTTPEGQLYVYKTKKSNEINLKLTNKLGEIAFVTVTLDRRRKQLVEIDKSEFKTTIQKFNATELKLKELSLPKFDTTYIRTQEFKKRINFLIENNYSLKYIDKFIVLAQSQKIIPDDSVMNAMTIDERKSYKDFLMGEKIVGIDNLDKIIYELPIIIGDDSPPTTKSQVLARLQELSCISLHKY